jgi:hypothetical protein
MLEENPGNHQKFFSDSSKDAKDEGQQKCVVKSTKAKFHKLIATFVFSADHDPNVHAHFTANTATYVKSVDNYIAW